MFGRVTFIPTLMYNIFMEKVSARQWYTRIDEALILGALPWRSITDEVSKMNFAINHRLLKPVYLQLVNKEKVRGVISMNEDYELQYGVTTPQEWRNLGVEFLQLKTADILHAPTHDKIMKGLEFINKFENTGNSVYVHCKAGRTRSATLVACYLIQVNYINKMNELIGFCFDTEI